MEGSEYLFFGSLVALIFIIAGGILYYFPPKKINALYGYRTSKSMKDQQHWDFAQKFGGKSMALSGLVLILSVAGMRWLKVPDTTGLSISLVLFLAIVAYMIFSVERAMKKKFED